MLKNKNKFHQFLDTLFLFLYKDTPIFEVGTKLIRNVLRFRLIAFEEIQAEIKLSNTSTIDQVQVNSPAECSQRCVKIPQCKSINICYRRVCHLNVEDRFSEGVEIEHNESCIYVGMKREFIPQCKHGNVPGTKSAFLVFFFRLKSKTIIFELSC